MGKYNVEVFYDSDFDYSYIFDNMEEMGIEIHHNSSYFLGNNNFRGDSVDYIMDSLLYLTERQKENLYKKFDTPYCNDCLEYLLERLEPKAILPVYVYEHSGSAISTTPFGCRWDSGQIGFIYVADKEKFKRAFGISRINTKKALEVMDSFISEINEIWQGDVYGFVIEDSESGECIDSCGGFIGSEKDVIDEMLDSICIENMDIPEMKKLLEDAFDNIQY